MTGFLQGKIFVMDNKTMGNFRVVNFSEGQKLYREMPHLTEASNTI